MSNRNTFFLDSSNSSIDRSIITDDSIPSPYTTPRVSTDSASDPHSINSFLKPALKTWDGSPKGWVRLLRKRRILAAMLGCILLLVLLFTPGDGKDLQLQEPSWVHHADTHSHVAHMQGHKLARPAERLPLTPVEELAALIAFMVGSKGHSLPLSIDPKKPLDPAHVLDFDPYSSRARGELRKLVEDTWQDYPVVLLSKRYSPVAREIRAMLTPLKLQPEVISWDLDERPDSQVIIPLIFQLTNTTELPILLHRGIIVDDGIAVRDHTEMNGDYPSPTRTYLERIKRLNETGALQRLLTGSL